MRQGFGKSLRSASRRSFDPRAMLAAGCFAALLLAGARDALGQATDVKPEFLMIIDSSGSMTGSTGSGNNSCGYAHTKMQDANCVFRRIADSTGDALFGLEKFNSQRCNGTCSWSSGGTCDATASSGRMLVGISENNFSSLLPWVDNVCSSCGTSSNPEITAAGSTPLEGSLRAAKSYFEGTLTGFSSPIMGDTSAACRPHYVILLTDGDETCGGTPANAATALRSSMFGGQSYDIKTYVIGFGTSVPYMPLESIATAGGTDAPGANRAFYATDEQSLSLAMSQIIAASLLSEKCNGLDDNCNGQCDEDFPQVAVSGAGCTNPHSAQSCTAGFGVCQRTGVFACTTDGSGIQCVDPMTGLPLTPGPAGTETCPPNGIDDDCNGVVDDVPGGCPVSTPEVCNGQDDDRNGTVDEWKALFPCSQTTGPFPADCRCVSGQTVSSCPSSGALPINCGCLPSCGSSTGICVPGLLECLNGALSCVGSTGPQTETCNGLDDNCNGIVDDIPQTACYTGGSGCSSDGMGGFSCQGACRAGVNTCVTSGSSHTVVCSGQVAPIAEIPCNGIDDNCNGLVDEPLGQRCYPSSTTGCTDAGGGSFSCVGTCATGSFQCQGGAITCVGATTPTNEICDGLDNNCDGTPDNFVCGQPQGICTSRCEFTSGMWQCNTRVGATTETCNNVDDDCNGIVDDNLGAPFGQRCAPGGATCDLMAGTCCGICVPGTVRCIGGAQLCDGATPPRPETCNGLDDNCDCAVDNNIPGFGGTCGSSIGFCQPGTFVCQNGAPQCMGGRGPQTETCNNIDDDCDGVVDNDVPGVGAACFDLGPAADCTLNVNPPNCRGICQPGTAICRNGGMVCDGEIGPRAETCNGQDDDCNGIIDDGFGVGDQCTVPYGACTSIGHKICTADGTSTVCNAPPVSSSPEVCDSVDNNCNGQVDEPSAIWPCPTGSPNPANCICPQGLSCANVGDLPSCTCAPRCGYGVGECVPGHLECQGGTSACVGGTQPQPELCNCLDDNCNGVVDDNPIGEGDSCFTLGQGLHLMPPATCRAGHQHCETSNGSCALDCLGQIGPAPEICDNLDNDCDGVVDNNAICPPSYACISGQCVPNCQVSEHPCPGDRACVNADTGSVCDPVRPDCVCLPNVCLTAACDLTSQDCVIQRGQAICKDRCPAGKCTAPQMCDPRTGYCFDCYTSGCPQDQLCLAGACAPDPCANITCDTNQFCQNGTCVASCLGVVCPAGQACIAGACQVTPCASVSCGPGTICNPANGMCVMDPCVLGCPMLGQACIPATGQCTTDPCATTQCPTCSQCKVTYNGGTDCAPTTCAAPRFTLTQSGGGGLTCQFGGAGAPSHPSWLLLFLALSLLRSFRRGGRR